MKLKISRQKLMIFYGPPLALLLLSGFASYLGDIPFYKFSRDPMAIAGLHPFLGIISNIGIVIWSVSLGISLFAYVIVNKGQQRTGAKEFIFWGGGITLILLMDDLLQLHENIFPHYFRIPEEITVLVYGVLLSLYLVKWRKIILKNNLFFLVTTFIFFGLSVVIDLLPATLLLNWHHLFEDGAKLLGIVSWSGYQATMCFHEV